MLASYGTSIARMFRLENQTVAGFDADSCTECAADAHANARTEHNSDAGKLSRVCQCSARLTPCHISQVPTPEPDLIVIPAQFELVETAFFKLRKSPRDRTSMLLGRARSARR